MKVGFVSFIVAHVARAIAGTLRLRVVGEEQIESLRAKTGSGVILVTWHGRTFIPITRFRSRGYWAMISTSRDGEYQNRLFQRFGFHTVRGSTSARGAIKGALSMVRELKKGAILAHTPDGPRGPNHVVHPGAIFLAQKSGCPIIPAGISSWPRWTLGTWDHYMIPRPFAKASFLYGAPIYVPPELDDDERQNFADRVGREICRLEAEAESQVRRATQSPAPLRDSGTPAA
jgi:lysophospholipid acyltransferase (LPLAT)-like uncharacterized protein